MFHHPVVGIVSLVNENGECMYRHTKFISVKICSLIYLHLQYFLWTFLVICHPLVAALCLNTNLLKSAAPRLLYYFQFHIHTSYVIMYTKLYIIYF
jgi:uncharacterized membrane protein